MSGGDAATGDGMNVRPVTPGLHHVTVLAADPQASVEFYLGILRLHLVKRTVDLDDPAAYHLHFGDKGGAPGSLLTVVAAPGIAPGRHGTGQVAAVAFAVPPGSLGHWIDRFAAFGVAFELLPARFGDEALAFADPDGAALELIATGGEDEAAAGETAITGLHSVTLRVRDAVPTARALTAALALHSFGAGGGRQRFVAPGGGRGAIVDVVTDPAGVPGTSGTGTVRHAAFRAGASDHLQRWQQALLAADLAVGAVRDVVYHRAIGFREPGGAALEIATDAPGFTVDEAPGRLGTALKLPPWLEPVRERLESRLPRLLPPSADAA